MVTGPALPAESASFPKECQWWWCRATVVEDDGEHQSSVGETDPDASNEEPQHIHEHAQTTGLWWFPLHLRAKRPDGQHAQLHALQTERDADDGYHQNQSCDEILNGSMQPAKDQPDDVS